MSKVCKIFKWCACAWGGSSGASNLSDLNDVSINNLQDWQVIAYNGATDKFQNVTMEGSSVLTSDVTTNVTVGGIEAGTTFTAGTSLESIIRQMLTTYIRFDVSMTMVPTWPIINWDTVSSVSFTINVTKWSDDILGVSLLDWVNIINQWTTGVSEWGTFTYTYTPSTPISANTQFTASVMDVSSHARSAQKTLTFVDGSYFGQVAEEVTNPTAADITALTQLANTTKGYTADNISMVYGKLLYAYPASYGDLTSIKDANNFEYITSYTKSTVTIDGVSYNCYLMTDATGVTGFKQIYA